MSHHLLLDDQIADAAAYNGRRALTRALLTSILSSAGLLTPDHGPDALDPSHPSTVCAIAEWQHDHSLSPTGRLDDATARAMLTPLASSKAAAIVGMSRRSPYPEDPDDPPYEWQEQLRLARFLDDDPRFSGKWFHVPNGGGRSSATASFLRACGVKAGVPDVWILAPCVVCRRTGKRVSGVVIELKRQRYGRGIHSRPSKAQRRWLETINATGLHARVAHGAQDAIDWLNDTYPAPGDPMRVYPPETKAPREELVAWLNHKDRDHWRWSQREVARRGGWLQTESHRLAA